MYRHLIAAAVLFTTLTQAAAADSEIIERKILFEKGRVTAAASQLARQFADVRTPLNMEVDVDRNELTVSGHPMVVNLLEQKARRLDSRPSEPATAMLMEFSVIEKESDGSQQVIASPRLISRAGEDALIRVKQDDRGLNLRVNPIQRADGTIQLDVQCRSWRIVPDAGGVRRVRTRRVDSEVVVSNRKRVTLTSGDDQQMQLELEVQAI